MYMNIYLCAHTYKHMCIYVHMHIHIHVHTYKHMYRYMQFLLSWMDCGGNRTKSSVVLCVEGVLVCGGHVIIVGVAMGRKEEGGGGDPTPTPSTSLPPSSTSHTAVPAPSLSFHL